MGSRKNKSKNRFASKQKSPSQKTSLESQSIEKKKPLNKTILPEQKVISRQRLWLFRIITSIVIPVLLLFLAELFLRVIGIGYPTGVITKCKVNDNYVYCNNLKFGWTFFPKNISRECESFAFPVKKQSNTYRIFILGASAAYGEPDPAYSFGRILQRMLKERYDGYNFEVINLGMSAINSNVVLKIAKDCARYQPDLFVVYLGNNEVVGPYGAGTVFSPFSSNLTAIRVNIALKSTRLGQLLQKLKPQQNDFRTWQGMAMFLKNQVRFDSPSLQYVYKHYERNLNDICEVGRKAGAKVLLCNVSCNLKDSPPFASQHRVDITEAEKKDWDYLYLKAIELESNGNFTEALKNYLSLAELDEQYADLHFRIGRCYEAMGDYSNAKNSYVKARDFDTIRFRPDTKINEIVRSVAEGKTQKGIYFVDTISAFENNSPNKIPGKELFYEHVHFTFKGAYLLARTVFEQVEKILPEQIKQAKNNQVIPTEQDCIKSLAFTGWDQHRIASEILTGFITKPPFTNQLYHEERVQELKQQIEALSKYAKPENLPQSAAIYKKAIEENPFDWKLNYVYAEFLFSELKESNQAISQFQIVLQNLPYYNAYNSLGLILLNQGNIYGAIENFKKGLKRKPTQAAIHYNLALALSSKKDFKGAMKHYSRVLEIDPEFSILAYHLLAQIYINNEKFDKAIHVLSKSIEVYPDNVNSHFGLATLYIDVNKKSQAIEELNTVLKLQPDYQEARQLLNTLKNKR